MAEEKKGRLADEVECVTIEERMEEEKKGRLADEVEGVTPEEVRLFKHGTHCDTMEELFFSIEENYKSESELMDKESPRSQWKRAVRIYEKELYESIPEMGEKALIKAFAFANYDTIKRHIESLLLNGAESWEEFSKAGNSLCCDADIEERLLAPSQRGKYGSDRLLSMQADALREAAARLAFKIAPVVDWGEFRAWRIAIKFHGLEGHLQRASFGHSSFCDFGKKGFLTRKVNVLREDINKTNDYAIMVCDGDTRRDACHEASGQLFDGDFENCRVGKCETVFYGKI